MKKNIEIYIVLLITLIMTASVFGYIGYENQKKEAARQREIEAKALEVQNEEKKNDAQEIKVEEKAEQPEKAEAVNKQEPQKIVKAEATPRTSTPSRGTKTTKPAPKPAAKPSGGVSNTERDLFYRLVSAEAAGESFEGKLAIATIVVNRVKSPNYPNTITGVIYDKNWGYQFTPVLDGRINLAATEDSKRAVDRVLSGYRSFGPEVLYFMNPSKSTNMWIIENKTYYKTIGNHKFYY